VNGFPAGYISTSRMGSPGRKPTVSDNEILEIFCQQADPVLTTAEVAAELDIGHRGTFDRLRKLADEGTIEMKKVGDSGVVWWYPTALRNRY
jgi:predicted transcriptional regulator